MESGSGSSVSIASGSNPESEFWWPKTKEKIQLTIFYTSFLIKNCNLLMSKLQEKPLALKRKHPALQKIKLSNFFYDPQHLQLPVPSYCQFLFLQWMKSTKNTWRIELNSYKVQYILPAGWPCHMAYKLSSELPGLCIFVTWNLKCMH